MAIYRLRLNHESTGDSYYDIIPFVVALPTLGVLFMTRCVQHCCNVYHVYTDHARTHARTYTFTDYAHIHTHTHKAFSWWMRKQPAEMNCSRFHTIWQKRLISACIHRRRLRQLMPSLSRCSCVYVFHYKSGLYVIKLGPSCLLLNISRWNGLVLHSQSTWNFIYYEKSSFLIRWKQEKCTTNVIVILNIIHKFYHLIFTIRVWYSYFVTSGSM